MTVCDVNGGNPATIYLDLPDGVSATPTSLTFSNCGVANKQNVTFYSVIPGEYDITIDDIDGGIAGSRMGV